MAQTELFRSLARRGVLLILVFLGPTGTQAISCYVAKVTDNSDVSHRDLEECPLDFECGITGEENRK